MMSFSRRLVFLIIPTASILLLLVVAGLTAWASSPATEGGWPPPIELSQSGSSSSQVPSLLLEDDGTLLAFWMQQAAVTDTLYYTVYPARSTDGGNNWSYTTPLTPTTTDRYEAAVDMGEYGGQRLVWNEHPQQGPDVLWYGQLLDTGWEEPSRITTPETETVRIVGPDIEVAGDWIHALWSEMAGGATTRKFDLFYSRSEGGDDWSAPIPAADTGNTSKDVSVASDQHDNLHVVWQEYTSPPEILYISGTIYATTDTVWSAPITISVGFSETTPAIAVGSDDVVHVVFGVDVQGQQHVQDVYGAHFPIWDTGSISPTLIPGSRVDVFHLLPTYASPAIALVGTDDLHVVWNGMKTGDFAERVYYCVSEDGGTTWSEPVPATPRDSWPDRFASVAADGQFVYLLYQQQGSGADQDIYYTKRFPVRLAFPLALKVY